MFTLSHSIKKLLPPDVRQLFSKLNTPIKIQDYLDALPVNFELSGESNFSPIQVIRENKAHCFEGAVLASALLAYHGHRPLLMDFATTYDDEDHTVALFKKNNKWGALSKTNHAVLKYRDPIYATPRELAMSYFHEYYLWDGRKSLRAYSEAFDLSSYETSLWISDERGLDWLMKAISKNRYFPVLSDKMIRSLRRASPVELRALEIVAEKDPRKKR